MSAKIEKIEKVDNAAHCPCAPECVLLNAMKQIGGKWKVPILCTLLSGKGIRYNEIMKKLKGITNTMLASSLKEMERDGLVRRVQYNEMPIRVEYFMTDKAKGLLPIFEKLHAWGFEHKMY